MYPVSDLVFSDQKLTQAERREIKMWADRASPDKRSMVRWIRDPRDKAIYIFVAEPDLPGTETAWVALNKNVAINIYQCELNAVPGA